MVVPGLRCVHGAIDADTRAAIERIVASQPTLEEVTRWALAQKPPRLFARCRQDDEERKAPGFDLVVQDEFTHDVIVPWNAEQTLFLVYDTT